MRPLLLLLGLGACAVADPRPATTDPDAVTTPSGVLAARLVRPAYDPAHHGDTCKPYHHVFAPDGRLLTKGLGGHYEHHRGLFLGWNQLRWRGRGFDFWHCRQGETQRFRGFVAPGELGLDDGWQVAAIDWCDGGGEVVLAERRALCARDLGDNAVALDLRSDLRAASDPVWLDGDPQHAGQQFRALQAFGEPGATPVRYVRPAGAAGQANDVWTGCRWIAAVLPLPDGDVTVLRVEGSGNPGPATWSTRGYGRFGATFTVELRPGEVLRCQWTYVVAAGARDAAWCERLAAAATR